MHGGTPHVHLSGFRGGGTLRPVLVRFRVVSLSALMAVALSAGDATAQIRPNPAAAAAARRALEADALAAERAQEQRQRQRDEAIDTFDASADTEALDPFEGIEDPLDEIDQYGDVDSTDTDLEGTEIFDSNTVRVEAPEVPTAIDDMDALDGFDDEQAREDREDSLTRRLYRAAEEELDTPAEPATIDETLDAGLDLDPSVEP